MYVIQRATGDGGGFVAMPGSQSSYVRDLRKARIWQTREAAQKECCPENERPVCLEGLLFDIGWTPPT